MIGIDANEIINRECPRYPDPTRGNRNPRTRMRMLDAFQEESKEVARWLVKDSLEAALSYIEWLEVCIEAADNEKCGIRYRSDKTSSYSQKDISDMVEIKATIRTIIRRLTV